MGLLDSLVGAVAGDKAGAMAKLAGLAGQYPDLLKSASSLLAADGPLGGLQGLKDKLESAGLGDTFASWIGTGDNAEVEGGQIESALGSDALADIAAKAGVDAGQVSGLLAQVLPTLVDQITPNGVASDAPADAGGIMGMLGGLLKG